MQRFLSLGAVGVVGGLLFVACGGSEFSGGGGSGASGGTGGSAGSAGTGGGGNAGSAGASGGSAGGGSGGVGGAPDGGTSAVGGAGATGGAAGAAGSGGSGGMLLDLTEFCSATADLYCNAAKPCCEQLYSFDQAACRTKYLNDCAKEVQAVATTAKTYHPEYVDQCQVSLEALLGICTPTARQFLENFDGLRACGLVFQGKKIQGQNCAVDSDCRPSTNANVHMSCGGLFQVIGLGTCQRTTALPEGANCEVGNGATENEICRAGLYCDVRDDVVVGTEPYQGTCQTAISPGDHCELLGGYDVQCGLGYFCKEGDCVDALAGGEMCADGKHEQCASGYCNPFANHTCLDLIKMVDEKDCGAPMAAGLR
ncbi:MAG: hypothetical protein H6718_35560 [Polyangiaceae bacterium]|nr:hypothetical protein [Myxococcales bacterium]MCB9590780.1 hypothetical protein [Polyangiaceae bacterium]MCB9610391.1 hypothetical protein [Polyangiaceae bacterium]